MMHLRKNSHVKHATTLPFPPQKKICFWVEIVFFSQVYAFTSLAFQASSLAFASVLSYCARLFALKGGIDFYLYFLMYCSVLFLMELKLLA